MMLHLVELAAADYRLGPTPYCRATVTTANGERVALPADCLPGAGHIEFFAQTTDVFIRFGDATVEVDATQASTLSGGAITVPGAKVPHLFIPANTSSSPKIPAGVTHFAHISPGTGGFLRFVNATGKGGTDT